MDSKERFSNRVDTYVKYRPSYPTEAINYLYDVIGLHPHSEIADIGAGTGVFSKLLLARGSHVTAVEPNDEMRKAAERMLGEENHFSIVSGSAEATGLPDHSIDAIVCAQSFHWFDRSAAQLEFCRILRPGGKVVLIWNSRHTHGTLFREEYDQLLQTFATDYKEVNHKNISRDILLSFFKPGTMQEADFIHGQIFDFEGLSGRLLSSSYSPVPGDPRYEPMIEELRKVFDRNNQEGTVSFDYETQVFWGEIREESQ